MNISYNYFGGSIQAVRDFSNWEAPNGSGKTTFINAYIFALTGKTIDGFQARYKGAETGDVTQVRLTGFITFDEIVRVLDAKGLPVLLIGGVPCSQTDFEAICTSKGVPIPLVIACANCNIFCDASLTADDLRKLLITVDVIDGGEIRALQAHLKGLRDGLNTAKGYAMTNISLPEVHTPEISEAECDYLARYDQVKRVADTPPLTACPCCKKEYGAKETEAKVKEYDQAVTEESDKRSEAERIREQIGKRNAEMQDQSDAQRLIDAGIAARGWIKKLEAQIAETSKLLNNLQVKSVDKELPEGVELVTTVTLKNGSTRDTCQLTYKGLTLKTVNYAKRVEICVNILAKRREALGLTDVVPIILDNAESVQGLDNIKNLVRLDVSHLNKGM